MKENSPKEGKQEKVNTKTYQFLMLIDFSEAAYCALKYTISIAKKMGGNIHLFHVVDADKFTQNENPMAVKKEMDQEGNTIKKKLKSIIEMIRLEGISATYEYAFGNEKEQIKNQINFFKPELTIIGRRRTRLNSRGKVTDYLLNKHNGPVLIAGKENFFSVKSKISLACGKRTLDKSDLNLVYDLHAAVASPLSIINIIKEADQTEQSEFVSTAEHFKKLKGKFQFKYPVNINITEGLAEHLNEEGVDLICIGRSKEANGLINRIFGKRSISTRIANKMRVPVLILGNNK